MCRKSAPALLLVLWLFSLFLQGCVAPPHYSPATADEESSPEPLAENKILYSVNPRSYLYQNFCAVVMPLTAAKIPVPEGLAHLVESAAARALSGHVARVVGPKQRQRYLSGETQKDGTAPLFQSAACPAWLAIELTSYREDFALIAAEKELALKVALYHQSETKPLWRARHRIVRRDGGVPLSLIGVGATVARSAMFHGDGEQFASLTDDAMRRLFVTLPDLR